jgi:hypothetical protein
MEHAVHLGAGHFIRVVSPTSTHTLIKKVKKAFRNAGLDDDDINLDTPGGDDNNNDNDNYNNDDNNNNNNNDNDDNDNDNDDDNDNDGSSDGTFSIGDTIGKSLALVKQVGTV